PAADLTDDTPKEVKFERLHKLQALINEQAREVSENMVGTVQQVLVEGPSKRDPKELSGKAANNRTVNFVGQRRLIGTMVNVRIIQALSYSLRGTIVTTES